MVFCHVVSEVISGFSLPTVAKLTLIFSTFELVDFHIFRCEAFACHAVCDHAECYIVVGLHRCGWLYVAHFFKCVECWEGFTAVDEMVHSLASAIEDMADLMIWAMARTLPMFVRIAGLIDMNKCELALLHAFVSDRYHASLWPARTMLPAWYVMIASGWEAA